MSKSKFAWDERIQIGMTVEITGMTVKGRGYGDKNTTRLRRNFREGERVKCMVLGRSMRFSGQVHGGYEDGRYLVPDMSHPVWMVQPLKGMKYMRAIAVYQDQIVLPEVVTYNFHLGGVTTLPAGATITSAVLKMPEGLVNLHILKDGEGTWPELVMPAQEATDGEAFTD